MNIISRAIYLQCNYYADYTNVNKIIFITNILKHLFKKNIVKRQNKRPHNEWKLLSTPAIKESS